MTLAEALERRARDGRDAYELAGFFEGGEIGAAKVVGRHGRKAVAKWEWPADPHTREERLRAVQIVNVLRARGAKIPRYLEVEPIAEGQLVIQEHVAGTSGDAVSDAVLGELVAFNALQASPTRRCARSTGPSVIAARRTSTRGCGGRASSLRRTRYPARGAGAEVAVDVPRARARDRAARRAAARLHVDGSGDLGADGDRGDARRAGSPRGHA